MDRAKAPRRASAVADQASTRSAKRAVPIDPNPRAPPHRQSRGGASVRAKAALPLASAGPRQRPSSRRPDHRIDKQSGSQRRPGDRLARLPSRSRPTRRTRRTRRTTVPVGDCASPDERRHPNARRATSARRHRVSRAGDDKGFGPDELPALPVMRAKQDATLTAAVGTSFSPQARTLREPTDRSRAAQGANRRSGKLQAPKRSRPRRHQHCRSRRGGAVPPVGSGWSGWGVGSGLPRADRVS